MLQDEVKKAVEVMRAGGVILYPTDTVWGIGCDATNEEAVRRVYEIKRRDDSKALICLIDSEARIYRYVRNVADVTWNMIELATKPLTIIFSNATGLARPPRRGRQRRHPRDARGVFPRALLPFPKAHRFHQRQRQRRAHGKDVR